MLNLPSDFPSEYLLKTVVITTEIVRVNAEGCECVKKRKEEKKGKEKKEKNGNGVLGGHVIRC